MKASLVVALILLPVLLLSTPSFVAAHTEGTEWFIVPHFPGDLQLETDHFAPQWSGGREIVFDSAFGHEISMVALNNGTHIYFHVRWADPTHSPAEDDGVALFFEGAGVNGSDDVWGWSTQSGFRSNLGVHSAAAWKDGYWNLCFGRGLAAPSTGSVSLHVGESKEGFLKVAVWDGSEGQSFSQIDPEALPHLNMYILPYIDLYPKDSFVWLSILGIGLVVFSYKELRVSGWRKKK